MHGAGVIEAIEEKEILGSVQKYYVMKMPVGDMKVMIPMQTCDEIGIRRVINGSEAEKVLEDFSGYEIEEAQSWNKRYRENMMRIKSGDIYEVAHVVKTLITRDRNKGLSTGERKMLANAKHILISELVLAKNLDQDEVETIIEELV